MLLVPDRNFPRFFPEGSQLATFIGGLLPANEDFPSLPDRARAGCSGNAPQTAPNRTNGPSQGSSSDPRAVAVAAYSPRKHRLRANDFCGGLGLPLQHLLLRALVLRLTALLAVLAVHALPLLSALALGSLSRRRRLRAAALGSGRTLYRRMGRQFVCLPRARGAGVAFGCCVSRLAAGRSVFSGTWAMPIELMPARAMAPASPARTRFIG